MVGVLLLAFALRVYELDFQSLEGDEGLSLQRSTQRLAIMWEYMPIEHVPGYFVLLYYWLRITGTYDFALRFLSVLPSVLAVALIYRLAADLGNRRAGWVAAALLATNGFQVWYAQQARMYSWLLATALLSNWLCWLLITRSSTHLPAARPTANWRWIWLGYVLATAATIYNHYYGFLAPAGQAIFVAIWWLRWREARPLRRWLAAGVAVFLLFIPWLGHASRLLGFPGWREPLNPESVPWLMWSAFTVGDTLPQPWRAWLPWFYLGCALIGLVYWQRRNAEAALYLSLTALAPFLLMMGLVLRHPDFHVRYGIYLSGPWLLLAAAGLTAPAARWRQDAAEEPIWARRLALAGLAASLALGAALLAANGLALDRHYHDTTLHKPDFRAAAEFIRAYEQPGDVILVDGPNPELVFKHYYWGPAPVVDLRPLLDADGEEVEQTLRKVTTGALRAWEVMLFRRPGPIQMWLATQGWAAAPTYHNLIRLSLYGLPDAGALIERPLNLPFGPELELVSVGISQDTLRAGDLLRISTHWQTIQQAPDYKFSLRLLDAAGAVVESWDYVPQNWFAPTPIWIVGQPATDQHAILIPHSMAPGTYRVTLRLYDPATGAAVETDAGQDVTLAEITVVE
jgi:hypothetical protein